MQDITAIIITKNEETNIVRCLESISGLVRRSVVVDSGSVDETVNLAKQHGADVYFHEFEYYAKQWNWGLDNCEINTKWVIRIDADESFPPALCKEIEKQIQAHDQDNVNGFWMYADYFFLGKKLAHGGKKKKKLMVFKTKLGRIEDRRRDAHTILFEGESIELVNQFEHYDFKDLNNFVARYNWYATREAMDYVDYVRGKQDAVLTDAANQNVRSKKYGIYYKQKPFRRAFLLFIYEYFVQGGWKDGKEGLIYHVLSSFWYRFLVDAKIYEYMEKGKEFEKLKAVD